MRISVTFKRRDSLGTLIGCDAGYVEDVRDEDGAPVYTELGNEAAEIGPDDLDKALDQARRAAIAWIREAADPVEVEAECIVESFDEEGDITARRHAWTVCGMEVL